MHHGQSAPGRTDESSPARSAEGSAEPGVRFNTAVLEFPLTLFS
jgi:hypothetical protein